MLIIKSIQESFSVSTFLYHLTLMSCEPQSFHLQGWCFINWVLFGYTNNHSFPMYNAEDAEAIAVSGVLIWTHYQWQVRFILIFPPSDLLHKATPDQPT